MPRRSAGRSRTVSRRRKRRLPSFWPDPRRRARWMRAFRSAPGHMRVSAIVVLLLALALAANWMYQVVRKPSELFFPVSGTLYKSPPETWASYAPLFRKHSTRVITPQVLAALAQGE